MDEMDLLRKTLPAPEPSMATVEAGRRRLAELAHGRSGKAVRRPRPRWLVPGIGLTAAVAAATAGVVLVNVAQPAGHVTTRPGGHATGSHLAASPASPVSARAVLDTAADAAQRTPPSSAGTYWYLKISWEANGDGRMYAEEHWSKRDGETWFRAKNGDLVKQPAGSEFHGPFFLAGQELTFDQLQELPTDPAALARWIATSVAGHGGKSGGPQTDPDRQRQFLFDSCVQLVSELPVPPAVRAAAFHAMGTLPGVTNLGAMKGGQGLSFTVLGGQTVTLIIDPATGRLLYTNYIVMPDGSEAFQANPTATLTGQWTNTLG